MKHPSRTPEERRRLEEILAEREIDYWDIVWGQFRQDRTAVFGLLVILVLFALAVFAPVLACHVPISYVESGELRLPLYRYLMNMDSSVDYVFNMAMLLTAPWIVAVFVIRRGRKEGISGDRLLRFHTIPLAIAIVGVLGWSVSCDPEAPSPSNAARGFLAQGAFLLSLVWMGQGFAAWVMGRGRKTPKRFLLLQLGAFLSVLVAAAVAFGPQRLPLLRNPNVLHPTYDLVEIQKEEYYRSAEFEGRGWWPPIRHSYLDQDREHAYVWPGQHGHVLGSNGNGYDILSQLLYGARIALTIGFVGVAIYMVIGTVLGALAGYFGGWIDILISRFVEVMITFPSFFLILVLVGLLQGRPDVREHLPQIFLIMIVIGLVSWTHEARLIRGEFLRLRNRDFVTAARALGVSNVGIIFRHILPNAIAPALVAATFGIGSAILTEGALSFLGIGIDPPAPSWGKMLRDGYDAQYFPFLLPPPAIMIFVTVTAYNLVGEGLRDSLDPHLRK